MFNQLYYNPTPQSSLMRGIVQQQPQQRPQGFGTHFKDSPPAFVTEVKEDNKIERIKKPKCPKGHKVCKCKKPKKNKKEKIEDYK